MNDFARRAPGVSDPDARSPVAAGSSAAREERPGANERRSREKRDIGMLQYER
jgi:hypothetical protein